MMKFFFQTDTCLYMMEVFWGIARAAEGVGPYEGQGKRGLKIFFAKLQKNIDTADIHWYNQYLWSLFRQADNYIYNNILYATAQYNSE